MKKLFFALGLALAISCTDQAPKQEETSCKETLSTMEVINTRRSIRQYKETPMCKETLDSILKCSINSPSGMNYQPWQIRVVNQKELIDSITNVFLSKNPDTKEKDPNFKNMFRNAPAVIFIGNQKGRGEIDCGMLCQTIMLCAHSLGYGTCCLGGPIRFIKEDADAKFFLDKLSFDEDYELLVAIAIGYPDESPEAKPRDASKIMFVE